MTDVTYRVEEERASRSKFKVVLIVCLVALVLVAGGTLAYLTARTNTESNVFTTGDITATLTEPNWVAADAASMTPGTIVAKNPQINNTTSTAFGESEYVAMKLTFQKWNPTGGDGTGAFVTMTEEELISFLVGAGIHTQNDASFTRGVNINTTDWSPIDMTAAGYIPVPGTRVYLCSTAAASPLKAGEIAAGASTGALFNYAGILSTAGNAAWTSGTPTIDNYITWLNAPNGCGGKFQIVADGAAVQGSAFNSNTAATGDLLGLLGYNKITP